MEEQFALRMGIHGTGELTLIEQEMLTAEDRAWWYKKLQKVAAERNKKEKASVPHIPRPNIPRR